MSAYGKLADEIAQALIAEGFTVHRYDSASTESIYLRLDWGACNSVRVSGHAGHIHARCRYNIGPYIGTAIETEERYPRFYWPESDVAALVAKCVSDRDARIGWCGANGYRNIVRRKKREAKHAERGFWTLARKVGRRK